MKTKIDPNITFRACIEDLYHNNLVKSMKDFEHHKGISCFDHSLKVSYVSYKIAKRFKLDYVSVARGGLLHDFYLYDWHKRDSHKGLHGFNHPKLALSNASKITELNSIEIDIIRKHMWPLVPAFPKYRESWVVQFIDKVLTFKDFLHI